MTTDRVRLHVSPLTPSLLPAIIPPAILPLTSNVSYHTLQTFPEKDYGYIELPSMEADKLKKKLNGAILKGTKMRVEKARPKKGVRGRNNEESGAAEESEESRARLLAPKRKREERVLLGYELPQERKVQRGWTEPTTKSKGTKTKSTKGKEKEGVPQKPKAQASTFTDGPECLFRAKLPPSAVDMVTPNEEVPSKKKKKQKATSERDVTVHEFSNTVKHAGFLRNGRPLDRKKLVSGFIKGKGWVDEDGDVVEGQPKQLSMKGKGRAKEDETEGTALAETEAGSTGKVGGVDFAQDILSSHPKPTNEDADETSSSGTSSESEDESIDEEPEPSTTFVETSLKEVTNKRTLRSSTVIRPGLDFKPEPSVQADTSPLTLPTLTVSSPSHHTTVHPLEALFKRPAPSTKSTPRKPPALEVKTSFSFFDQTGADGDTELETQELPGMPQTPFTQHDLQHRRLRSAAPTPDTAAPGRSGFGAIWGNTPDDKDNDVSSPDEDRFKKRVGGESFNSPDSVQRGSPGITGSGSGTATAKVLAPETLGSESKEADENVGEKSEFAKWFWENRGETNRAWKKRRREAAKEQRQRENRKKVK